MSPKQPSQSRPAAHPAARPAAHPAARPAARPAAHPAARPAAHPAAHSSSPYTSHAQSRLCARAFSSLVFFSCFCFGSVHNARGIEDTVEILAIDHGKRQLQRAGNARNVMPGLLHGPVRWQRLWKPALCRKLQRQTDRRWRGGDSSSSRSSGCTRHTPPGFCGSDDCSRRPLTG